MDKTQTEIVGIQIPFKDLLLFMLKLAVASIPAIVIIYLVVAWLYAALGDAILQL